ncbi:hypothetical protein ACHAWO_004410 [Cyclotella atomus]|uniref:Uncharacterized protein n=1 Tax=Cyclotella atomus TaxID=382360 RepID=A0ABD3N2F8_9STRA
MTASLLLQGQTISDRNRAAVEMAILCEAGMMVTEDERHARNLPVQYKAVIQSIPRQDVISSKLLEDMMERQKNGQKKGGFKTKTLWVKWGSAKTTIRKIFAGMPDKYHNMKSGTQIYNAHQKLVRDHYRATFPDSTTGKSDDELDGDIPDEFWVEHPACLYILTVKVHQHNTCFTKECADVALGGPATRAEIRDKAEERKGRSERTIRLQEKRARTEREMARENILSSRKKRETATVENKQTQMKLLKKNRKVYVSLYGQEAYDRKLGELLTACLAADNLNDNRTDLDTPTAGRGTSIYWEDGRRQRGGRGQ